MQAKAKALLEIGLGVAATLVVLYVVRQRSAVPGESPDSASSAASTRSGSAASAPPRLSSSPALSEHQPCRDLTNTYRRMNDQIGCPADSSALARTVCEGTIAHKPECVDELEGLVGCTKGEPASGWECDSRGRLGLKAFACSSRVSAFRTCMK